MNILITGGCGYVGHVLTPKLLAAGHKISVVDTQWFGNLLEPHENLTVLKADVLDVDAIPMEGMDSIIHLANIANDPCGDLNSKLTWEVNALATMHLVEKAIDCGVGQFIYASSGSVYGVKEEEKVTEDLSLVPISDYNKTKMISERVLMSYMDRIPIVMVRPATVCGTSPRMRLDLSVSILTMSALDKGKITVFGGNQTRPNIHMGDMVRVYEHFLANPQLTGVYNAGFENISILDIANKVKAHVDVEIEITPSNDPRSYRLCSDKLLATGFEPKFGVENGILDVIDAYKDGWLRNEEHYYNIKTMLALAESEALG